MPAASTPLLTALKSSLQNTAHGWQAGSYVENTITTPGVAEGVPTVTVTKQVIVSLYSTTVRIKVGERPPLSVVYIGLLNAGGVYQSATLILDALSFSTTDSALHAIVMSMINSRLSTVDADVTASLTHGPQVF